MIEFGWFTGLIPLVIMFFSLLIILVLVNILARRYKARHLIIIKKILFIIMIILIIFDSFLLAKRIYAGPKLSAHVRLGYYAHRKADSIPVSHLHERTAANRIYLSRYKVQWNHFVRVNGIKYYFPKDMPEYTRKYVIKKNK